MTTRCGSAACWPGSWPRRCCASAPRAPTAPPPGALAAAEGELTARVSRLLAPQPPLPRAAQAAVVLAAALVAVPLLLLVIP